MSAARDETPRTDAARIVYDEWIEYYEQYKHLDSDGSVADQAPLYADPWAISEELERAFRASQEECERLGNRNDDLHAALSLERSSRDMLIEQNDQLRAELERVKALLHRAYPYVEDGQASANSDKSLQACKTLRSDIDAALAKEPRT